jgi:hypothetical protein
MHQIKFSNYLFFLTILFVVSDTYAGIAEKSFYAKTCYCQRRAQSVIENKCIGQKTAGIYLSDIIKDAFCIHQNLFSWDTLKIAAVIVPAALITRKFDEKIQCNFYDAKHHKNICQLPKWTHELARIINGPVITFLGIQGLLSSDTRLHATAQAMLIGFPFLMYANELIKKMKFECALRPWHEKFSCKHRTPGGFPSGHVAKASYLATLYGLQYGYRAAIPLSLIAAGIGAIFVSSNRHYLSQVIAGIGFGVAYGFAASKLVDFKVEQDICFNVNADFDGSVGVQMTWLF